MSVAPFASLMYCAFRSAGRVGRLGSNGPRTTLALGVRRAILAPVEPEAPSCPVDRMGGMEQRPAPLAVTCQLVSISVVKGETAPA